jgi:hypothetical protein
MSIALFNIRLTTLTTRIWKNVDWTFFVVCTAYIFAALFLNVFKCHPQYGGFNLLRIAESDRVPKCLSVDFMNSILHLSWKRKARVSGVLSIGLIACIGSAMALVSQYTLENDPLWK